MIDDIRVETEAPARERILQSAQRLFYRDGIRATGTNALMAEAGVAKVTFYRHFASKNALVEAFLQRRHGRWMAWFEQALSRHGGRVDAIVPALAEWLTAPGFRGCAFLNSVGEYGATLPAVNTAAREHKRAMVAAIAACMAGECAQASVLARSVALAIDGAIMRVQSGESARDVLADLDRFIKCIAAPH